MELINTHCHTHFCGHGEGDVEDYVNEARRAHLTTLAFTEHYPLSSRFDPDGYLSVPADDMAVYEQAVRDAQAKHQDMEILLGIEMDYLGSDEDRDLNARDYDRFDVVLGSVHFVDGWPFDDPAQRDRWELPGEADRIWNRYIELWCEAAANPELHFDVMSHPDLAKKFNYYPSYSLDEAYARMAEAACAGGRLIEVNTSGSYYACAEIFPALPLLKAFHAAGVGCTVGCDAHVPENVARDIERGYDLMRRAGYTEVTVPTRHHGRRTIELQ